jgi:hypothetical protein
MAIAPEGLPRTITRTVTGASPSHPEGEPAPGLPKTANPNIVSHG